jgi:peptide/nickel transport system substrate-binding protein
MFTTNMGQPDPQRFMNQFLTSEVASKANKWQGRNSSRWSNKDYDALYEQAQHELDAVKRAAMFIKLNEMVVGDRYIQPEVYRLRVVALKRDIVAPISGWDLDFWQLANWYRET